jgi:signal transduction histidine kinase
MNHEVRTPLTSITGFAEILQQDLSPPHDDHAKMIFDSSRRLMRTLDAVMQFSELEAGTEALRYESFDLRDEVQAAIALVRDTPKDDTVRIDTQLPAGPVPVHIGRVAVRRILHHLSENAVKFSPPEATATITLQAEERVVHVEVHDDGIGIPEEAQSRIFEPFIQKSEGLQREYEGTGLGLAIVQRLVIALGGMLSIDSTPGAGTTVRLTLPRTPDDRGEVARHVPTRGHVVIAPSREADHFDEVARG